MSNEQTIPTKERKPKPPIQQRRLIPDCRVRERYSISVMTLWRWDRDPNLNFPKAIHIRGRKYRDESELDAFDASRRAASRRAAASLDTTQRNDDG
jgi:predicted DNA-binding transcriptional regulator AlpA